MPLKTAMTKARTFAFSSLRPNDQNDCEFINESICFTQNAHTLNPPEKMATASYRHDQKMATSYFSFPDLEIKYGSIPNVNRL